MKLKYILNRTVLALILSFFSISLFAQKIQFETLEINYGNIVKGADGVRFKQKSKLYIESQINIKKRRQRGVSSSYNLKRQRP